MTKQPPEIFAPKLKTYSDLELRDIDYKIDRVVRPNTNYEVFAAPPYTTSPTLATELVEFIGEKGAISIEFEYQIYWFVWKATIEFESDSYNGKARTMALAVCELFLAWMQG